MDFLLEDYKEILKAELENKKRRFGQRFTYQAMAKTCKVQKTYLSRVFNSDAHLNSDQLYLACDYLGLDEEGRRYLQVLHELQRSSLPSKQAALKRQLEDIRRRNTNSEGYLSAKFVTNRLTDHTRYYTDPDILLVHMHLTIPHFQTNYRELIQKLRISDIQLTSILTYLENLEIIEFQDGKYHVLQDHLQLRQDADIMRASAKLLRLKGMQKYDDEAYQFSVVISANEQTRAQIKKKFLEFLRDVEELVKVSPSEEVYQMSFDLLKW